MEGLSVGEASSGVPKPVPSGNFQLAVGRCKCDNTFVKGSTLVESTFCASCLAEYTTEEARDAARKAVAAREAQRAAPKDSPDALMDATARMVSGVVAGLDCDA